VNRVNDRRGIALFLTLGFTTLLVMMLAATLTSTHGGNIFSQDYHRKTAALYAAETGLAMVQEELEKDPDWRAGFNGVDTPFGSGKVWVSFGPSVNNLPPKTPPTFEPGPYGPVAPGTAYIRVEGRAQGQTEVIECILGRKSEDFLSAAIVATGKIQFDEDVDISGRVSSEDLTLSEADVISNYDQDAPWGDGTPPVNWDGSSTPDDRIAGTIRSASPPNNSISANLNAISDESLTDQVPVSVENIDIQRAVDRKSGVPTPVPLNPTGPLSGEYYSGDRTVAADVVLDNASLYVDGDLKVLGSIRGVGAVYVTGSTTFAGDSTVMSNEDGVVLYSKGNVHLRGFDGTEWMNARAAAEGKTLQWNETKECMRRLTQDLESFAANPQFTPGANPAIAPPPDTPPISDPTADDYYWRSEAGLVISVLGAPVASYFRPPGITGSNLLDQVTTVVTNSPSSGGDYDSQAFMLKKFKVLHNPAALPGTEFTDSLGTNVGTIYADHVQNFQQGPSEGFVKGAGLQVELFLATALIYGETMGNSRFSHYAGLTDHQLRTALVKHAHWLKMYDFDRLGESYFQGNIYTRGAIYASNEVTILGSLAAVADPNEPMTGWTPPDRDPDDDAFGLKPGDVYLGHGTRIVHLGHLKPGLPSASPPVGVVRWLR
jgi:hypothetical protein